MVKLNFSYVSYFKVSWSNQTKSSIVYSKSLAYFLSFMYILIGIERVSIKVMAKPKRKKLISLVITPQTSKRKAFQFVRVKYNNSIIVSIPSNCADISKLLYMYSYLKKMSNVFLSIMSFQAKSTLKANVNLIYIK